MTDAFRTLIVPAANADLARRVAASFGAGGAGMWITALSASGSDPATHFISSGYIPTSFADLAPFQTWKQDIDGDWQKTASSPGDPIAVYDAASAAGVVCTQQEVSALFAAADVTEQEPSVALARLGLQLVYQPIG